MFVSCLHKWNLEITLINLEIFLVKHYLINECSLEWFPPSIIIIACINFKVFSCFFLAFQSSDDNLRCRNPSWIYGSDQQKLISSKITRRFLMLQWKIKLTTLKVWWIAIYAKYKQLIKVHCSILCSIRVRSLRSWCVQFLD